MSLSVDYSNLYIIRSDRIDMKVTQPRHIHVPIAGNELLEKAMEVINDDVEIKTLWKVINVNAIDRLGMSDHGPVHVQIVANIALRLARILIKRDMEMS